MQSPHSASICTDNRRRRRRKKRKKKKKKKKKKKTYGSCKATQLY